MIRKRVGIRGCPLCSWRIAPTPPDAPRMSTLGCADHLRHPPSHGLAKMDDHFRLDGPLPKFAPVQIYVPDLVRLLPIQEDDVVSNAWDDRGLELNVTVPGPSKGKHGHRRATLQVAAAPWHRPRCARTSALSGSAAVRGFVYPFGRWTSTGGKSSTCCLVMLSRMPLSKEATAAIGIATSLRPHKCPSWRSTQVTW